MEFIQMFRQFFDRKSSDAFSMGKFGSSGDFKSHRIQFVAFFWPLVAQVFRCRFCFRGILYLPLSICLEFGGDLHPLADGRIQLDSVVLSQSVFPIWWSAQFFKRPVRHLCYIWWSAQFLPRIYQPCLSQSHQCVSINPQFSPKNPPTKQSTNQARPFPPESVLTKPNSHWIGFTLMAVKTSCSRCCTIRHNNCTISIRISNRSRITLLRRPTDEQNESTGGRQQHIWKISWDLNPTH